MKKTIYLLALLVIAACKPKPEFEIPKWVGYDESEEIAGNADHEINRMKYKLIQSKHLDKNKVWDSVRDELKYFDPLEYERLQPLIYERSIPEIQNNISDGLLTYEELTLWYLYRIVHTESDPKKTLHSVIALNPNAVSEARQRDRNKASNHPIFGMPVILKDNINTTDMRTTAGAIALKDNQTNNAFIVEQLVSKGAIILGKANLSEWAYFFCGGCPVGYSAVGGQTLNPYGRRIFETGGSSSGSGTTMAANYATAAVGTETSGSILSPSGANSVVGLKPTIGRLSRTGIVPISSTLDTPGPMTRSVIDNAILMDAMGGYDNEDDAMSSNKDYSIDLDPIMNASLEGKRFGALSNYIERDSIYASTIEQLKTYGAEVVVVDPIEIDLQGFRSILNIDMRNDLPKYLQNAGDSVAVTSVKDVLEFNLQDSLMRMPYGQIRLAGTLEDTTTTAQLEEIIARTESEGRKFFDTHMDAHNLDAMLSINNWGAGTAAVAKYPCLTVPMGYRPSGEPRNLTFIGKQFSEQQLLELGYAFEQAHQARKPPEGYN